MCCYADMYQHKVKKNFFTSKRNPKKDKIYILTCCMKNIKDNEPCQVHLDDFMEKHITSIHNSAGVKDDRPAS